ncbi:MAG: sulfite exporter TauE/SafE family protein, partial [Humidesulfovibrio sp.]|nr:sulfite exporter TauE/SafE family protein [Humidesulfovibrio sp.]
RTELVAAVIMLVGASMGAQVGAVATKYIKGYGIRYAFGLAVVGCMVSIILKLAAKQFNLPFLDDVSTFFVLSVVSALSLYIFVRFVQGCKKEVAMIAAAKG